MIDHHFVEFILMLSLTRRTFFNAQNPTARGLCQHNRGCIMLTALTTELWLICGRSILHLDRAGSSTQLSCKRYRSSLKWKSLRPYHESQRLWFCQFLLRLETLMRTTKRVKPRIAGMANSLIVLFVVVSVV